MTQEILRPVADNASGGAESDTVASSPRHAEQQQPRTRGGVRKVLGWMLLVMLVVAIWPATWGGLTGITVVNGHSMEPAYENNDMVLTLRHSSYAVGDVVSYKVPEGQDGAGGRVIHRIIAVDDSGVQPVFTTQGDNNPSVDPWRFSTTDIVGEATLRVPRIGGAFNGSSGLMLGAVVGFAVLVVLWPSRPKPQNGAPTTKPTHETD
ncbi:signal peptidase I [Tessaracoccus antarcticus]|nr:signal peptidase I [Tessaracoccus antarcticus]